MNGVHDMGGMHGFGPIVREENEPVFHAGWEARVWAMEQFMLRQGLYNLDAFRYGIEQMPPADYLRSSYYERWLATVEYNLIQNGVVDAAELDARVEALRRQTDAALPRPAAFNPRQPAPEEPLPARTPRFAVGDAIVTRNVHPAHHTRLARYTRGKRGVIHLVHGPEVFADTNAHGRGQQPQVVYCVRFDARELWGESAEPSQTVNIDLWESYLLPAADASA
jgi:nitrile hydratase beta subunit